MLGWFWGGGWGGVQAREFMKGPTPRETRGGEHIFCPFLSCYVEETKLNSSKQACPGGATPVLLTAISISEAKRLSVG